MTGFGLIGGLRQGPVLYALGINSELPRARLHTRRSVLFVTI